MAYQYGRIDPRAALQAARAQNADLRARHDINVARIRDLEAEVHTLRAKAGRMRDINMGDLDAEVERAKRTWPEPAEAKEARAHEAVQEMFQHGRKPRCGTYSGFMKHKRLGTEPCEECVIAQREYRRSLRARKKTA